MTWYNHVISLHLILATIWSQGFARLNLANEMYSIASKTNLIDIDPAKVIDYSPDSVDHLIGISKSAYRSSVMASMSQLDRGDKEAAMQTLKEAMVSIVLFGFTHTFGFPVMSDLLEKIVNKYGYIFPETIAGLQTYNKMIVDAVLDNSQLIESLSVKQTDDVLNGLDVMKNKIRKDFEEEVGSFVRKTKGYEDLVSSLSSAKKWAKVSKWSDILAGPLFDIINIAFSGWQLQKAIQNEDDRGIASASLGFVGSVLGVGSFIVGILATTGSTIPVASQSLGLITGFVLSLAAIIIDVINAYNPSQSASEHLGMARSLTNASMEMLNVHQDMALKVTQSVGRTGFRNIYDVNQAMLVQARMQERWDTIKGQNAYRSNRVAFAPDFARVDSTQNSYITVGDARYFDMRYYENFLFKPSEVEEMGYDFYGRTVLPYSDDGITVRATTDLIDRFWINGVNIRTFRKGMEGQSKDDNVEIGDFRGLYLESDKFIVVETGGGDDVVSISGVICNQRLTEFLRGKCIEIEMGEGEDTLSFEGLNTHHAKRLWYMKPNDISNTQYMIGIKIDLINNLLHNRLRNSSKAVMDVRVGSFEGVERFIGSPLNDIIILDNAQEWMITEHAGYNQYELHISQTKSNDVIRIFIEDNSDHPGKLKIIKNGLTWSNIMFYQDANAIIVSGTDKKDSWVVQVLLKMFKPSLEQFRVQLNDKPSKNLSNLTPFPRDILLPYIPYKYKFDKDLAVHHDVTTYIELLNPGSPYPSEAKKFEIKWKGNDNYIILSEELLDELKTEAYALIAKRTGRKSSDGGWRLLLHKTNSAGGWQVSIGKFAYICTGNPGFLNITVDLRVQNRDEVNVYAEYKTIKSAQTFDFGANFNGDKSVRKVIMRFPSFERNDTQRLNLDIPQLNKPTESDRNEIILPTTLMMLLFANNARRYFSFEIIRADVNSNWHLEIASKYRADTVLNYNITLKGVHAFISDQNYHWKEILDLYNSEEKKHDLIDLLRPVYFRWF